MFKGVFFILMKRAKRENTIQIMKIFELLPMVYRETKKYLNLKVPLTK